MIEYRWCKGTGYVTDTAVLSGRDVTGILLGHRPRTIITMTFCAVINPTGMIKGSVSEISGVMADTAIFGCALMNCRIRRSSGSSRNIIPIMTRGTITGDTRVIEN